LVWTDGRGRSATHPWGSLLSRERGDWPGDLMWRRAGGDCIPGFLAGAGFRAAARAWVKLERPQRQRPSGRGRTSLTPASGGRRSGARKSRPAVVGCQGVRGLSEWSHIHPSGAHYSRSRRSQGPWFLPSVLAASWWHGLRLPRVAPLVLIRRAGRWALSSDGRGCEDACDVARERVARGQACSGAGRIIPTPSPPR
jgi:hypothetical protein